MAIDWASSDDEEFPDLDVVLERVKAAGLGKSTALEGRDTKVRSSKRSEKDIAITSVKSDTAESAEWREAQAAINDLSTVAPVRTVRRRLIKSRAVNPLLQPIARTAVEKMRIKESHPTRTRENNPVHKSQDPGSRVIYTNIEDAPSSSEEDDSYSKHSKSSHCTADDDITKLRGMTPSLQATEMVDNTTKRPKTTGRKLLKPEMGNGWSTTYIATKTTKMRTDPRQEGSEEPQLACTDLEKAFSQLDIAFSTTRDLQDQKPDPDTPQKQAPRSRTLVSPQKIAGGPKTPHRPSMDLFWDQEFVNEWNEEYSPRKLFLPAVSRSPSKSPTKGIDLKSSAEAKHSKKTFEQHKHQLAESFLNELDQTITKGQLQKLSSTTGGIKIHWSNKLNTTAGRANWKRETLRTKSMPPGISGGPATASDTSRRHHASIELAEKVIDDENRLLNVIAHEFCHLANFMISEVTTNPHGKEFKAWASKVSRAFKDRGIEVTTKHSYEIDFKYIWECTKCGVEYKRHSKSIKPETHRCGVCKSSLQQTKPAPRKSATTGEPRASEYQLFVKENMRLVKQENPSCPQRDLMKLVAAKWAGRASAKAAVDVLVKEINIDGVANRLDALAL